MGECLNYFFYFIFFCLYVYNVGWLVGLVVEAQQQVALLGAVLFGELDRVAHHIEVEVHRAALHVRHLQVRAQVLEAVVQELLDLGEIELHKGTERDHAVEVDHVLLGARLRVESEIIQVCALAPGLQELLDVVPEVLEEVRREGQELCHLLLVASEHRDGEVGVDHHVEDRAAIGHRGLLLALGGSRGVGRCGGGWRATCARCSTRSCRSGRSPAPS
jgi:hypothetical protein